MSKEEEIAKSIILQEIHQIDSAASKVKENGCAACHVLFKLIKTLSLSESDAGDLLSQALFEDPQLNDRFIEMVEKIHMKERMMGVQFSIKSREAKDRFIDANLKNVIAELSFDIKQYGKEPVLRKLLLSLVTVQLAQNIGVDHHAATEELYYFMKKNIDSDNLIHEFINKISKVDNDGYS